MNDSFLISPFIIYELWKRIKCINIRSLQVWSEMLYASFTDNFINWLFIFIFYSLVQLLERVSVIKQNWILEIVFCTNLLAPCIIGEPWESYKFLLKYMIYCETCIIDNETFFSLVPKILDSFNSSKMENQRHVFGIRSIIIHYYYSYLYNLLISYISKPQYVSLQSISQKTISRTWNKST